jgi:uncharacterized protein (TIGR00299 family) protein
MTILYYDCFTGISGDMNLAAMLDLGVPEDFLKSELAKLHISGYEIITENTLKMGISGTKVYVNTSLQKDHHDHNTHHGHSHGHGHHHDKNNQPKENSAHHHHRTFKDIREIISNSALAENVKKTSIKIFEKVAVAEAKIHNKSVDNVHFHEVGAIDSIVDIVGAAICYHYLNPDRVLCSTVELGGGFVNCAHGKFPVPAPATAEILKEIPVRLGTVNFETTTPTGAAILATLVDEFTDAPAFKITKTCYGIGHRDLEIPNVLRVHSAESSNRYDTEKALIIESNLDDMSPEHYEYLIEKLLSNGANDVFITPMIMKKTRPATKISVLCTPTIAEKVKNILFSETTTLGIRSYEVQKEMLKRTIKTISTKYGDINIKISEDTQSNQKVKPEYDQCRQAAIKHNTPLRIIIDEVLNNYYKATNK